MDDNGVTRRKKRKLSNSESDPYVLRSILDDIPLETDGSDGTVSITCVEYWNDNLYIGTSASEILHLVGLPAEDESVDAKPTFILASRLEPSGHAAGQDAAGRRGVQQILVLPGVFKACVLCNGVVSFYSLPELSPAFPNKEPTGVQWIGGLDENEDSQGASTEGPVVMIANSKRILLVRVGDKLRPVKPSIEYPGCLRSSRRDTIACVADGKSYALLEVQHQQKIPLFPISSAPSVEEQSSSEGDLRRRSPQRPPDSAVTPGHKKSTSMGNFPSTIGRSRSPQSGTIPNTLRLPDALPNNHNTNPKELDRPASRQRSSTEVLPGTPVPDLPPKPVVKDLVPHIISPFSSEFMLTTGTSENEPGVGMFVNLDGEVVRGTIEFSSYPEALTFDNFVAVDNGIPSDSIGREVVLALLRTDRDGQTSRYVELQNFPGSEASLPIRLALPAPPLGNVIPGLSRSLSSHKYRFAQVSERLQNVPLIFDSRGTIVKYDESKDGAKQGLDDQAVEQTPVESQPSQFSNDFINKRLIEERKFVQRFGVAYTNSMTWHGQKLWEILENPLILQLESQIRLALPDENYRKLQPRDLLGILTTLRLREPRSETDFLTINYVRQKLGIMLFLHLQTILHSETKLADQQSPAENALHEGGLDPRIILLLIPPLAGEVYHGKQGIWIQQGLAEILFGFISPIASFDDAPIEFWMMIRHYLTLWQEKRGYGSITDEKLVFDSVDAALLHVLLHLDCALPQGSGVQTSVKAKLNNVVDHWKGEFKRAASLLERYHRLYLLSRLYQSRKQAKDVLNTWKRIIDGEKDVEYSANSEELEIQIKRYLTVIRDQALVQEYGIWLAQKKPTLGVQIFADDSSRVKFVPQQVIALLKQNAPGAVQQYLEHLVFGKHLDSYADDLIGYYLDSVLNVLESSEPAREVLAQTYSTYRALSAPKPTYLNFIRENAPSEPWWQSRMRLLQLLGSGGYASTSTATSTTNTSQSPGKELTYSIPKVLERLAPFSSYLVSESIILDSRQGRHKEALRLLTHGLGDFDTAIRYCYFGHPASTSSSVSVDASSLPPRSLQTELFNHLFTEFLSISTIDAEDQDAKIERTAQLLGKFASFFDPLDILQQVPDEWDVGTLNEFLTRSLREATTRKNEAVILKALSAVQNLKVQVQWIEGCEKIGARVEPKQSTDTDSNHSGGGGDDGSTTVSGTGGSDTRFIKDVDMVIS